MSSVSATDDNPYAALGLVSQANAKEKDSGQLGLEDFLNLMTTQMANQDPLSPMENGDFLGQIAQFGTVSGIEQLNKNFGSLSANLTSGQALQASSLVGREVLVPSQYGYLPSDGIIAGQVDVPSSAADVVIEIQDMHGQTVREVNLGQQSAGPLTFAWDGLDNEGEYVLPGQYEIEVRARYGDTTEVLDTNIYSGVESVTLGGADGLSLNLYGLGSVPFSDVKEIY